MIAMQVLEQSVPLWQVNIKQPKALNLVIAGGLILDVLKHIGLKIAAGEHKGKISSLNQIQMLRPDHDSCQDGDSSKYLTLFAWIWRSPDSHRFNSHNRNRTTNEAGMQLRTKHKPPVQQAIFVDKQFFFNLQANLE
ncbi:HNH endonuclease [Calothrix sp. NIES-2100]|nr:HNH endonuclease [Calothrix sp. NIES-2100]